MDKESAAAAIGATDIESAAAAIGAPNIREVMKSQGPIVNTVVLRCRSSTPDENDDGQHDSKHAALHILSDLIDEVKIDTTPSKSKVSELLGGPFTFLGQYEDEGIVLMIRKFPDDLEGDLKDIYDNNEEEDSNDETTASPNKPPFSFADQLTKNFNVKALKAVCLQRDIDTEHMVEKQELVQALVNYQQHLPPYNEHKLQPPLHNVRVRGDIVIMKVAETEEELDSANLTDDNDTNKQDNRSASVASVPSNEEFFLDYSKAAYIKFASRTDIPEHDIETEPYDDEENQEEPGEGEHDEGNQEEPGEGEHGEASKVGVDDGDDSDDDDYGDIDENDKSAMFNLVMNEVLRQYREENGRGPNTQELLELRANIAKELGVEIANRIDGDWDKKAKKNSSPSTRRIAFTKEADEVREYVPDPNEYPSDNDDDDYYDIDDADDILNPSMGDYEEEDDSSRVDQPPTKRLKTSEDDASQRESQAYAA